MIKYDSNLLELTSFERVCRFVDSAFCSLKHNQKNDEFDFTDDEKTWAVEQVTYISSSQKEEMIYEIEKERGKLPDPKRVKGAVTDSDGNILSYIGGGMTETRIGILKMINEKDKKCRNRLAKETTYKRIDLIVTIPEDPLFDDKESIKPLDEWIAKGSYIFEKIIVLFFNSIYVFDAKTGNYSFTNYSYNGDNSLIA